VVSRIDAVKAAIKALGRAPALLPVKSARGLSIKAEPN